MDLNVETLSAALSRKLTPKEVQAIIDWENKRPEALIRSKSPIQAPTRWKLPDERMSYTHHFEIGDELKDGVSGYLHCGMYDDYRLGELFIRMAKMGSFVSGFADAWATSLSISLQHGIPLKMFTDKFSWMSFDPAGMVRGSPAEIRFSKSVIDYIARFLALRFPDGYLDQAHRRYAQKD